MARNNSVATIDHFLQLPSQIIQLLNIIERTFDTLLIFHRFALLTVPQAFQNTQKSTTYRVLDALIKLDGILQKKKKQKKIPIMFMAYLLTHLL